MGVVFKAEDTKLRRTVALKFLPARIGLDPKAKMRFLREAQTKSDTISRSIGVCRGISYA